MTDRIAELARQRQLVQQHLAWLDRQLADAAQQSVGQPIESSATRDNVPAATPIVPDLRANAATTALPPSTSGAVPPRDAAEADEIMDQFRVTPAAVKSDVRKGCFIYFVAAFLLLGLGITAVYFIFRPR
jgi:hypothetical protein